MLKTITKTLAPNVTEVSFTDEDINNNSIIEVYTNDPMNVYPVEQSQSGNTVTIKVNPHSNIVGVKIFINNTNDFSVMDNFTTDNPFYALSASRGKKLKDDLDKLDQWVYDVEESLNDTIGVVNTNSENIENLETSKQDKLIEGENITIVNNVISATGGGGGGGGGLNYSTTEQDTGLLWINGKHIYQKSYSGTTSGFDLGVNIDTLVDMYGVFKDRYNNIFPLSYYVSTGSRIRWYISGTYFYLDQRGADNLNITLTLFYTKN